MVTEAWLVAVAVVGAKGLHPTIAGILFNEERSIVDVGGNNEGLEGLRHEDVVNLFPQSLIAVVGPCPMRALHVLGGTNQPTGEKVAQGMAVKRGIEIASNDDRCLRGSLSKGVYGTYQHIGYLHAVRTCL